MTTLRWSLKLPLKRTHTKMVRKVLTSSWKKLPKKWPYNLRCSALIAIPVSLAPFQANWLLGLILLGLGTCRTAKPGISGNLKIQLIQLQINFESLTFEEKISGSKVHMYALHFREKIRSLDLMVNFLERFGEKNMKI